MNEITEIAKWSPPILLVVALNCLGMGLKKASCINNKWIPLVLPVAGAVVYCFLGAALPLPWVDKIAHPTVVYAIVGFIAGSVSVWGHQAVTNILTGGNALDQDTTTPTT